MGIFDDMLRGDESLFLDSIALDVDYMPPVVKHREGEQGYIAQCLKPLFSRRSGKNVILSGSPGVGKTVATKHLIEELKEQSGDIKSVYINCWKKDTPYKVVLEMCNQLGFRFTAGRNTDELIKEITNILNKSPCVIILDEADKIDEQQIFYTLFEDIFTKSIICITNEKNWLSKLDERVRSRMLAEVVEFKSYNYEEIKDILRERVNYAFVPNVLGDDAFEKIVEKTHEMGDVRSGLFLLKNAGEEAEGKSKRKIELADVEKAIGRLDEFQRKSSAQLGEEEEFILKIVKTNSGLTSSKMHIAYQKAGGKQAYTTFQRKLKNLGSNGFITLSEINIGKGRSTKVTFGLAESEKKLADFS
ncbi:AAA family ATPase [Candidatus Woesearchaeota archaeon]|jgi:archaeal cell division control protein 6|nr:AAA family ATPase [Candidatus Woesearchaeota archaeon]MBT5215711.1 AAA family ATPase [Candidatus Woesearchaeota archaeon]MBT6402006.1 AAA family ATPase [Candidatus Woesearchaeota archaeon]